MTDGRINSRSEVADDHGLSEVDLTGLSELLKPFKVVAIDGVERRRAEPDLTSPGMIASTRLPATAGRPA
jgi:hypothetical protein